MGRLILALWLACSLSGCMSLLLQAPDTEIPVSLNTRLHGYRSGRVVGRLQQEVWTYHLLGLPQIPLGTREGLATDQVLAGVLQRHVQPGQGVIRLRVQHLRTPLTWTAAILSLGLLSPTAVRIEGEIVELLPASGKND